MRYVALGNTVHLPGRDIVWQCETLHPYLRKDGIIGSPQRPKLFSSKTAHNSTCQAPAVIPNYKIPCIHWRFASQNNGLVALLTLVNWIQEKKKSR
jgi:hypothetical protein